MRKHKVTIALPSGRVVAVEIVGGFSPGKVEIGVMFRIDRMEAAKAVLPKTTELSEAFKRRFPLAGTFGPVVFHDDPALRVVMDNGAKRALIPIENKRTFLEVSADIVEHVDPIFYGDPKTAALKVLGGP